MLIKLYSAQIVISIMLYAFILFLTSLILILKLVVAGQCTRFMYTIDSAYFSLVLIHCYSYLTFHVVFAKPHFL